MIVTFPSPVALKMVEPVSIPERVKNEKGGWDKTGRNEQFWGYTFISDGEFPEKFYFVSKNDWRALEGKLVEVDLKITHDDFARKSKVTLSSIQEA